MTSFADQLENSPEYKKIHQNIQDRSHTKRETKKETKTKDGEATIKDGLNEPFPNEFMNKERKNITSEIQKK